MKKTVKQLEKKARKEEKKIHSKVKKEFNKRIGKQKKNSQYFTEQGNKKSKRLVDAITKSVILNKRMLGRDNYQLKRWQELMQNMEQNSPYFQFQLLTFYY